MATSARASAQSSHTDGKSPDTSSGSADASSSIPQNELDFGSLAIDACDKADSLRELLSAYTCVEKLIEPAELGDSNLVNPTRTELGALVRVVNEEMERRIDSIDKTLHRCVPPWTHSLRFSAHEAPDRVASSGCTQRD